MIELGYLIVTAEESRVKFGWVHLELLLAYHKNDHVLACMSQLLPTLYGLQSHTRNFTVTKWEAVAFLT